MAGFTAAAVNTLDFDFTGIPSATGVGNCTGKGVVAEPTESRLEGLYESVKALASEDNPDANAIGAMRQAVVDFCGGTPTAEEVADLPPRYLAAFARWLLSELGGGEDPKG